MNMSNEEFRPQKHRDAISILSNLLLLVLTLLFLWVAFAYYQNRIEAVTLNENRYLTTEWQLLGELKAQTDEQLAEKEQQIADLQRKYNELQRQNASDQELDVVQSQLEKARNERENILSQRVLTPPDSEHSTPLAANSSVNALLEQNLKDLESELVQSKQKIEALQKEISDLKNEYNTAVIEHRIEIRAITAKLREQNKNQAEILEKLQSKADMVNGTQSTELKDINTRVLLKAIVSSPMVRNEYPQLQEELDRYLQILSNQQLMEGRRDAYLEAVEMLKRSLH